MSIKALEILCLLQVTHWIADYTHLSTKWMLDAKRLGKPLAPIFIHASIHMILVQIVLICFISDWFLIIELMALQLFSHWGIDVLKGRLNGWYPTLQSPANKFHWYMFGADQMLHQFVLIIITYLAS